VLKIVSNQFAKFEGAKDRSTSWRSTEPDVWS
jgi:hypothetical protein